MSTGAIGGTTAGATSGVNAFSNMSSSDFVKIMMSELQNQDPTQPTDSTSILNQLSSLQNINSQLSLQTQLQNLVGQNSLASASGLIGKEVNGTDSNGNALSGVVTSVNVQNGSPVLNLDSGQTLGFANVTEIADPAAAAANGTAPTAPVATGS